MVVRTFYRGLVDGLHVALKDIDKEVASLGNVTIHSVQDSLYQNTIITLGGKPTEQLMVRVVIYTP